MKSNRQTKALSPSFRAQILTTLALATLTATGACGAPNHAMQVGDATVLDSIVVDGAQLPDSMIDANADVAVRLDVGAEASAADSGTDARMSNASDAQVGADADGPQISIACPAVPVPTTGCVARCSSQAFTGFLSDSALSNDAHLLAFTHQASAADPATVYVLDLDSGRVQPVATTAPFELISMTFSPDNTELYISRGSAVFSVRLSDNRNSTVVYGGPGGQIAASSDGRTLYSNHRAYPLPAPIGGYAHTSATVVRPLASGESVTDVDVSPTGAQLLHRISGNNTTETSAFVVATQTVVPLPAGRDHRYATNNTILFHRPGTDPAHEVIMAVPSSGGTAAQVLEVPGTGTVGTLAARGSTLVVSTVGRLMVFACSAP